MALRLRSEEVDNERLRAQHLSEALEREQYITEEESEMHLRTVEELCQKLDRATDMTTRLGQQVFNEEQHAHLEENYAREE